MIIIFNDCLLQDVIQLLLLQLSFITVTVFKNYSIQKPQTTQQTKMLFWLGSGFHYFSLHAIIYCYCLILQRYLLQKEKTNREIIRIKIPFSEFLP